MSQILMSTPKSSRNKELLFCI